MSSIRLSISAAETLSRDIYDSWKAIAGHGPTEGLGSTEMLHIYLSNTPDDHRIGAAGAPVPGYDIRLERLDGNEAAPWCGYWIGPFPLPGWLGRFFQPRKLRFADLRGKRHTLSVVAAPSPEDIRWHRAADWASPAGGSMGAAVASGCGACGAAIFSALEPLRQVCVGVLGLSMGSGVSRSSSRWRRAQRPGGRS